MDTNTVIIKYMLNGHQYSDNNIKYNHTKKDDNNTIINNSYDLFFKNYENIKEDTDETNIIKFKSIKTFSQSYMKTYDIYKKCEIMKIDNKNALINIHEKILKLIEEIFKMPELYIYNQDFIKDDSQSFSQKIDSVKKFYIKKNKIINNIIDEDSIEKSFSTIFKNYKDIENTHIINYYNKIKSLFIKYTGDKIIDDAKFFTILIKSLTKISNYYSIKKNPQNATDIVFFSNDLMSSMVYYSVKNDGTKNIILHSNKIFIIGLLYDIYYNLNFSEVINIPLKYIIENKSIDIVYDHNNYIEKNDLLKNYFKSDENDNEKKIVIQNYDLLLNIYKYDVDKDVWNYVKNINTDIIEKHIKYNNPYINKTSHSINNYDSFYNNFDKDFKNNYYITNRFNGIFCYKTISRNHKKEIFCDLNNFKMYDDTKWERLPFHISMACAHFYMNVKNEKDKNIILYYFKESDFEYISKLDIIKSKTIYSVYINISDNDPDIKPIIIYYNNKNLIFFSHDLNIDLLDNKYLISNCERKRQCTLLVNNYYFYNIAPNVLYRCYNNSSFDYNIINDLNNLSDECQENMVEALDNVELNQLLYLPTLPETTVYDKIKFYFKGNVDIVYDKNITIVTNETNIFLYFNNNNFKSLLQESEIKLDSVTINNTKTLSFRQIKHESLYINYVYFNIEMYNDGDDLTNFEKYLEIMFKNALLIAFMNNILLNTKDATCYFKFYQDEPSTITGDIFDNNIYYDKIFKAIQKARDAINILKFKLNIVLICTQKLFNYFKITF